MGEKIFFDTNLSALRTQSCASCHNPATGFTDPDAHQSTSLGGDGVSFGTRNSPSLSYVGHIPDFEMAMKPSTGLSLRKAAQNNPGVALLELPLPELLGLLNQNIVLAPQSFGGFFLDGRAATLEEQAKIPFFAANEMGLNSPGELVQRLRWSWYSWEFTRQFGYDVFSDSERTLNGVAKALAAYQRTQIFAPFTSKFDRVAKGIDQFSASEARGQALFNGKAGCFVCHTSPQGSEQVFSNFLYFNVGAPKNYEMLNSIGNPDFIDRGRALISGNPAEEGKFRTPTLRNVAKTAPYMHNGVFKTLHEVVNFYNIRDIAFTPESSAPTMTPAPVIGNLGFTPVEVDDIVAFLRTLSDE
ncbi:MAG: cytochrome-c peroxidase [Granulosicoccus sp.]